MRWQSIFIGVFLAIQVLAPLEYYCNRADPHDERFAWRMFSPERMVKCQADFRVGGNKVELGREFHQAWLRTASRGRIEVINRMARKLCDGSDGQPVRVDLLCREVGARRAERVSGDHDVCLTGSIK